MHVHCELGIESARTGIHFHATPGSTTAFDGGAIRKCQRSVVRVKADIEISGLAARNESARRQLLAFVHGREPIPECGSAGRYVRNR